MVLGHIRRVELGQNLDLLLDILDLVLRALEVDDLYRDRLLRAFVIPVRRAREIERVTRGTQGREGGGGTADAGSEARSFLSCAAFRKSW